VTTPPAVPAPHPILRELELVIRARYPLIWLVTHEERRAERLLRDLATRLSREITFWSCTEGFDRTAKDPAREPLAALETVQRASERRIWVLRDFHPFLEDHAMVRKLREVVRDLRSSYKSLLLMGPVLKIPPEIEKDVTVIDLPLPTSSELTGLLSGMLDALPQPRIQVDRSPELLERVVKATLGLSEGEAENIFAKAIVSGSAFGEDDLPMIIAEKKQILRKSGLLEYYELDESLAHVGGLERLKGWLSHREQAFSERAREFGLPAPRGLLLLGVQGCGKSLTAKAIAAEWKLPLLRLDVGRIFSSFVGASESNMHQAIKVAESLAPAILWVDEIEKGFAGTKSSGSVDAGTTARVFATLLTWLQEKTAPVFVVATANRIADLPPELLRKGRFDEIFFIDLPSEAEREEITRIHLARRRRDPASFDITRIVAATDGWSGAEIEQGVIAGLHSAFAASRELATEDILRAASESVPLSRTMTEEIEELRDWARLRARPAG